jgi:hypothetical protein
LTAEAVRRGNRGVAVLLAWVFPGLGHAYLGRRSTALLYALIVTATFLLGESFEVSGAGLLNLAARFLSSNPGGTILAPTYEYGCAYLLTAGLMNLLLMLDAWDIGSGRK